MSSESKAILRVAPPFGLIITAILLAFAALRWPLLDIPMERDEGEYATIGLGMLHGVPPYLEGYTMKLPGGASMYAAIFWLLGPSVRSIHLSLLIVNAACILLMGILGRRLLGVSAGLFAAAAYGTFTWGTGMYGFWLSAEHFAVFFLLLGAWILPSSLEGNGMARLMIGSLVLGTAVLIKQHAVFPSLAWASATAWAALGRNNTLSQRRRISIALGMALFWIAPFLLTCALMSFCGVFEKFRFWTWQYAFQYVSNVPLSFAWKFFTITAKNLFQDAPLLWILSFAGAILLASRRLSLRTRYPSRLLLLTSSLGSAMGVSMGWLFRGQYFILFAPCAALFSALAWHEVSHWMRTKGVLGRIVTWVLCLSLFSVLAESYHWTRSHPFHEICRSVYGMNPFPEYPMVADYLREHTLPDEKVAVLGSEPGIYFLANRSPATPYLCAYEMMKSHRFARDMQLEAIRSLQSSMPKCIVAVVVPTSWGQTSESDPTLFDWLPTFLKEHYTLDGVIDLISESETVSRWGMAAKTYEPRSAYTIRIFARKH